ncbi:MAG: hypothetical protein AAGA20_20580 [Planctomycetota bacterium]
MDGSSGDGATVDDLGLTPRCEEIVGRIGEEFLAAIYVAETERRPDNIAALAELGHVYTRLGRYEDGLAVDAKLVEMAPDDPTVRYNLACSQALVGRLDAALDTLGVAVDLGYDDVAFMRDDDDLASLRGDPRFEALVQRLAAD